MKTIRLQISGKFLDALGMTQMLEDIDRVDVLNAYQYDQKNFFSLQKICFKPDKASQIDQIIKQKLNPNYFLKLKQTGSELLCIMKQRRTEGFFPVLEPGPWAFIFPISVTHDLILINILIQEEYIPNLYNIISAFTDSYKVIGISNLDPTDNISHQIGQYRIPLPNFTTRQQDIATYAAKNGYFNSPKKITAKQIAQHFKISETAVNKHLRKAENLAMKYFFGEYLNKSPKRRTSHIQHHAEISPNTE
ncbi:MAG: helix-turn-helix domain-containing protein [Candidatus Jordarchaeum sp.]|uniref:helix-turn-helix domain-containing protein n=1 Tax=Candidatus Jordarchaeum sp. TaxID=2823881 RepID=UPI004049E53A